MRFLSIPEGSNPREYELEGDTYFRRRGSHLLSFTGLPRKRSRSATGPSLIEIQALLPPSM